ncbi:unnamed protein product [Rotaria sp. Silwood2]|nr:unnamed protein product [Rotaria sp. Silwood2]CAF2644131.1 unnamed protein product [Rotaria sp. Silwood2]CAF2903289.1 unnamed protein product [Rotaria sp. Silwood2]CAF3070785.1 unnamed protein product [Rotaria sp. Silwood2]CAF3929934.1 unnamed protein product [Rotaria sp. Silwood2]
MNIDFNHGNLEDHDDNLQLEQGNTANKEQDFDDNQYVRRPNRKKRNEMNDLDLATNSTCTPKRQITEQIKDVAKEKLSMQGTAASLSYFNNNHTFKKGNI